MLGDGHRNQIGDRLIIFEAQIIDDFEDSLGLRQGKPDRKGVNQDLPRRINQLGLGLTEAAGFVDDINDGRCLGP